jgi:hypothetical protein
MVTLASGQHQKGAKLDVAGGANSCRLCDSFHLTMEDGPMWKSCGNLECKRTDLMIVETDPRGWKACLGMGSPGGQQDLV